VRGLEEDLRNTVAVAFAGFQCQDEHEFYPKRETMAVQRLAFDPDPEA
jgi:hypothetical protein